MNVRITPPQNAVPAIAGVFVKGAICSVLLWFVLSSAVYAQYPDPHPSPTDPMRKNVTPTAPDAWQFMKYGEYPVSRETGVPNITIPIYTATAGDLSVPINLSYHAAGNRIDEIASWIGLGWTLNSGGMISRTIKGRPDESFGGILFQNLPYYNANGVWNFQPDVNIDVGTETDYMNLMRFRSRDADAEPDLFNYNFGGFSGRFYLDPKTKSPTQCKGVTQPKSDVNITVYFTDISSTDRRITSVVAITPDGTKYTFDVACFFSDGSATTGSIFGNASWYLSKIQSPNGADQISFYYKNFGSQAPDTYMIESATLKFIYPGFNNPVPSTTRYVGNSASYTGMMVPDYIDFPTGKVVFNSVDDRQDDNTRRLASIDIFDKNQPQPIKSFVLGNTGYFVAHNYSYLPTGFTFTDKNKLRLKLSSLQEIGLAGESNPPYTFTYLESGNNQLPPRHGCAQDYWGFYNGANSNVSLVPLITLLPSQVPYWSYDANNYTSVGFGIFNPSNTLGSANREPDGNYMTAGIINSIRYPTGGSTVFTFEPNVVQYSYVQQNSSTDVHYSGNVTPPSAREMDSQPFTVNQNYPAALTYSIAYVGYDPNNKPQMTAESVFFDFFDITANNSLLRQEVQYTSGTANAVLIAGHQYQVRTYSAYKDIAVYADIKYTVPPATPTTPVVTNKVVGGLRVKQISDYDFDGKLTSTKTYDYNSYKANDQSAPDFTHVTTNSSGRYTAATLPDPQSFLSTSTYAYVYNGSDPICQVFDYWFSAATSPSDQLGFTVSSPVTYEYVTERVTTDDSQGRSIFNYDAQTVDYPFVGYQNSFNMDRSWLRGQPLHEYYFNNTGRLLKQVDYTYDVVDFPNTIIRGVKVDKYINTINGVGDVCLCDYGPNACGQTKVYEMRHEQIRIYTYDEPIQWKRLISKTETLDDVSTTTTLEYQPQGIHTNVLAVQTTNSKNEVSRTQTQYAYEANNTDMLSRNMTGIPLVSDTWKDVTGSNSLAGGSRLTYGYLSGLFVPTLFEDHLTDGTYQVKHQVNAVNATSGRIESFTSSDGMINSYKWGYNNEHPIVKVVNAAAKDIFYTSFEDSQGTSDGNSKTGNKLMTVNYSITINNISNGSYILSYWQRSSNVWSLVTTPVAIANNTYSNTLTATSSVPIDEVRLCPVVAQMTTYTYDALVGVTSITDPNNVTTYYEYDNLNRLKFIRDFNRNIVKAMNYNYQIR